MDGITPETQNEKSLIEDPTLGEDQVDREAEDPDYVPSGLLDQLAVDDLEDDEDISDDLDVDDEDEDEGDDFDVEPSEKDSLG